MLCVMAATALGELLEQQMAVVARNQLLRLGMTDRMLHSRVREGGHWQVLLPGVYLTVTGAPTLQQKEMAALLYAGPGSVITGPMALFHYSIGSSSLEVIQVLVPARVQRRSVSFVQLERTSRMPEQVLSSGPIRLAPTARAVADTARQLNCLRDIRGVVADAVQRGHCTLRQLADELSNGPVRRSAMFRSALTEVSEGIRSAAEGDLRDLIRRALLRMPLFNPSLYDGDTFIAKPDAWWPDAGVAVEVDSRAWHLSPEAWERTMHRHDLMEALGIAVLHFSPRQLRQESPVVMDRIRGALEKGRLRPALSIRTIPCTP
jgi:very-short-patch-repair endonuclease